MLIRRIAGCTDVIGKDQGYLGLPIRQRNTTVSIGGVEYPIVATECALEPTPDELTRLNNGHSVIVQLLLFGSPWPPIQVYVDEGKAAEEDDSLIAKLRGVKERLDILLECMDESPIELIDSINTLEGLLHDLKID